MEFIRTGFLRTALITVFALLINGCGAVNTSPSIPTTTATTGFAGSAIRHTYISPVELKRYHIQAIPTGDVLTIVMASDDLFVDNSPSFTGGLPPYSELNVVSQILRNLGNSQIQVTAYTDNVGGHERNMVLTHERARNVAYYLWQKGIDTRLIYADGKGECSPVATNDKAWGRKANRRIEIIARPSIG